MAGTMLATLGIESLGIGVDQWFGSVADPSSPIVSGVLLPIFLAIAAAEADPGRSPRRPRCDGRSRSDSGASGHHRPRGRSGCPSLAD